MGRRMKARVLLEELRGHGVELTADGEQLRYRPKSAVTSELLDRLKEHKVGVLSSSNGSDANSKRRIAGA